MSRKKCVQEWTNKRAILRDLSTAQGRIPGDMPAGLGARDKPPVEILLDETEEEFYRSYSVGGDFSAPDCGLIMKMLDMVRENETESTKNILQISKLDPEFVPKRLETGREPINKNLNSSTAENTIKLEKKPKKIRNVALASILSAMNQMENGVQSGVSKEEPVKLLKPEDFSVKMMTDSPVMESIDKVNNWMNPEVEKKKPKLYILDPSLMFKKRTVSKSAVNEAKVTRAVCPPVSKSKEYVPTARAEEHYRQCMERKHAKEVVEDMWTIAMRQMKEIDERRLKELEEKKIQIEAEVLQLQSDLNNDTSLTSDFINNKVTSPDVGNMVTSSDVGNNVTSSDVGNNVTSSDIGNKVTSSDVESEVPSTTEGSKSDLDSLELDVFRLECRLPVHRHLLDEACAVCALVKHHTQGSSDTVITDDHHSISDI